VPEDQQWRKNLFAIAVAQFIALGGGNLIFPFMPFYVEDLGVSDPDQIAIWSGLLGTATGTMLFIFSPIWGSLADRFGRKQMLLRAYVGAMVTITLQGLVQNVWQLVLLRGLQGIFVGTIPAATALVASGTPKDRVAYALGVVQMALFTSQFIGPLVGGVMAESLGFRTTFLVSGAFYIVSFLLVLVMVHETFTPPAATERGTFFGNLRDVLEVRPVLLLIGVVFFLNAAPSFVRPLVPLVIGSFDPEMSAATLSGIAFAALSVTSAGAALAASRLGDRAGYRNALAIATIAAGIAYFPLAFASSVPAFIMLLAVVGLFAGGVIPLTNALIEAEAPAARLASAFGLGGSAMALAFAVAPLLGGLVASSAGLHAPFVVVGCVMVGVGIAVFVFVREPERREGMSPAEATGGSVD
jgi:DHA1 family multidrug resistance protein-like MFS transporter